MNKEDMILEALAKQSEMIGQISGRLDRLETDVSGLKSDVSDMRTTQIQQGEQLTALQATQTRQGEQLTRLEKKVDELDERSLRTTVLLESDIAPKVQLLLDGHTHLVDTLAPKKRVEKMEEIVEERVFVLESVVKSHAERITALEKAQ